MMTKFGFCPYLFDENFANVVSESVLDEVVADLMRQPAGNVRRIEIRFKVLPGGW